MSSQKTSQNVGGKKDIGSGTQLLNDVMKETIAPTFHALSQKQIKSRIRPQTAHSSNRANIVPHHSQIQSQIPTASKQGNQLFRRTNTPLNWGQNILLDQYPSIRQIDNHPFSLISLLYQNILDLGEAKKKAKPFNFLLSPTFEGKGRAKPGRIYYRPQTAKPALNKETNRNRMRKAKEIQCIGKGQKAKEEKNILILQKKSEKNIPNLFLKRNYSKKSQQQIEKRGNESRKKERTNRRYSISTISELLMQDKVQRRTNEEKKKVAKYDRSAHPITPKAKCEGEKALPTGYLSLRIDSTPRVNIQNTQRQCANTPAKENPISNHILLQYLDNEIGVQTTIFSSHKETNFKPKSCYQPLLSSRAQPNQNPKKKGPIIQIPTVNFLEDPEDFFSMLLGNPKQ